MSGIRIAGNTSGNVAEVSTNNELRVALGNTPATSGIARMFTESDPGAVLGTPTLRSPETSQDYRLRVGMDSLLLRDTFNSTTQNTGLWSYSFSTMTAAQPGAGTVNFGAVQGTAAGHGVFLRSFRYFPVVGTSPLSVEFTAGVFGANLVANETWAMGLGLPSAAGTLPTDGVFLRLTNAGWEGVIRYNGTESATGVIWPAASIVLGDLQKWVIVTGEQYVQFWRNDVLLGQIATPAGQGQPFMQASQPAFMQKICTGSVTNTNTMRVSDITVTLMDLDSDKAWPHACAGGGMTANQAQNGATMGGTATYPNSTNPTAAAPSNTALTANLPAGLGGQGTATLWNLAATDMILNSYTNPAGGINQSAKTLHITACRVHLAVFGAALTAPAAGAHLFQLGLAFGHTADSLATAETASFANNTTKAPRRKALGLTGFSNGTAPVGTLADRFIDVRFDTPVVVNPGERVAIIAKMLNGAATASGQLYYTIDFDGYWE